MAVTWTFTEVSDTKAGRARFNDERGHRCVRGVLSAGGAAGSQTYTTGGDNLPVVHFKEVRRIRLVDTVDGNDIPIRTIAGADVTIAGASPSFAVAAGKGGFTQADVGRVIVGTNIPANTFIIRVIDADTVTMSANASGTASGNYIIGGDDANTPRPRARKTAMIPVVVAGVPGKVKLYVPTTVAEVAGAVDVTGTGLLVEIIGK